MISNITKVVLLDVQLFTFLPCFALVFPNSISRALIGFCIFFIGIIIIIYAILYIPLQVTGNRIWKHFCGKPIFSSPHCDKNYVFVGCVDGNLYCFNHSGEKVKIWLTTNICKKRRVFI